MKLKKFNENGEKKKEKQNDKSCKIRWDIGKRGEHRRQNERIEQNEY